MLAAESWIVLVVEDEPLVRGNIASALRDDGWVVLEAHSGEAAIAQMNSHRVDVVFTDIELGGQLTGWDVAEACRILEPEMPIIYTTGHWVDGSRSVRDSVFFAKPYLPADVVRACNDLRASRNRLRAR